VFTTELTHGNVKKIVADPTSGKVHLITPIFPLGKITNHAELIKRWGVSTFVDKVYGHLQRAIGKADLTVMKTLSGHFAHPTNENANQFQNYTYQSQYSIGKLAHVFKNPDSNRVMWGAYEITEPVAKPVVMEFMDSYNKGLVPLFTSSQIVNSASENPLSIENFDLMHTTLTDDPSFGKELTKVGAVCQGDVQQCTMQIRTASNTTEKVNVMIIGKDVEIHHKECPFCVAGELRHLFKQNSSLKLNKASNLQMSAKTEEIAKTEEKVINPDVDQKKDSSVLDPKALADDISSRITETFNKQVLVKPDEQKTEESPKTEEKKEEHIKVEGIKEYNIEDDPKFKKMQAQMEKMSKQLESSKVDSEELKTLRAEQNFNKIGTKLAEFESNFINPETGKADPKAFDKAFEFLQNMSKENKWSLDDIGIVLSTLSPYGNMGRTVAPEKEMSVIQKAANNHGVPQLNAAFQGKEETHSASNNTKSSGLSLVDSILRENEV
jgi:hypothetical protein